MRKARKLKQKNDIYITFKKKNNKKYTLKIEKKIK